MGNTCKSHENNDVHVNTHPPRIARRILAYENRGGTHAQKFRTFRNSSVWISTKMENSPRKRSKSLECRELWPLNFHNSPTLNPHPRPLLAHLGVNLFFLVRSLHIFSTLVRINSKEFRKHLIFFRFWTFIGARDHIYSLWGGVGLGPAVYIYCGVV